MTKEALIRLIDRYLDGDATPEEEAVLNEYFERFQGSQEWDEELLGPEALVEEKLACGWREAIAKSETETLNPGYASFKIWRQIAAAVLITMMIGGFLARDHFRDLFNKDHVLESQVRLGDLSPGQDIASLTLQDGSVINLSESIQKEIVLEDGSIIQRKENGQLIYKGLAEPTEKELTYHVLSTPKGGQYMILLSDGTKVWLNSETSLRFPTAFTGKERNVELKGEAYFDIAKDKHKAFKVSVKGMEVTALGTEFNINAYEEEEMISTTLFEGSVRVKKEKEDLLLVPGQHAQVNRATGTFLRGKADLEAEIAWKEGYFVFNNEDIQSIMTKLSRWYDAEIEYQGDMSNKRFTAIISRRSNISEILEILESTGTIHFKIVGRRVTVMA